MKSFKWVVLIGLSFYLSTIQSKAQSNKSKELTFTLTINNLPSATATLYVGFYKAENSFPKFGEHAFNKVIMPQSEQVTQTWNDIPEGEYAIAVYQDLNNNQVMEQNLFGLPKEPYGFSTNFKAGMFSIPSFEKCKVKVNQENNSQSITLIN